MPKDGCIYIIQMEMDFIYNGCLFTTVAPKNKQTLDNQHPFCPCAEAFLQGHAEAPKGREGRQKTQEIQIA